MQINNSLKSQKILASPDPADNATASRGGSASILGSSTHSPSPELAALVSRLREVPELREEVVREVAQRLARGDYSTPHAIDRTVQAMLDATVS